MFTRRQHQIHPRGDDRTRIAKARQEAEALFSSRRPTTEPLIQKPVTPPDQSARKPRILRALSPPAVRYEQHKLPINSEKRMTPKIPKSHFARIRGWVKYGMTAVQVAGIYGVGVDVIERILNHAR